MDPISRREAVSLGRKRFYTGRPCLYGHDSERYTTSGNCIACVNPKLPAPLLPPALEKFKRDDGLILELVTQGDALLRGRTVFFTGQPCAEGHMSERNVRDGRCLECSHPRKYGPDADTGWWPFAPKPPLRIPPGTPLAIWPKLASAIQAVIPGLVAKILAEEDLSLPKELEHKLAHGHLLVCNGQMNDGYKLWYPFATDMRLVDDKLDPRAKPGAVPWIEHEGHWFAVLEDKSIHVLKT